jgi:integrase
LQADLQNTKCGHRTDTKFYGCGVEPRQLLRDAVDELGAEHAEELKAFLLGLVLGLRRREADLLEWESFDFEAATLRVMPTRWHTLKTNESAAVLPVEPEILAFFRAWRAKANSGFVIESDREPKAVTYQCIVARRCLIRYSLGSEPRAYKVANRFINCASCTEAH